MKNKNYSLSDMGKALTKADKVTHLTSREISARLSNDNMSFDKAIKMLDVLNCKIVIQDEISGDKFIVDQVRKIKLN